MIILIVAAKITCFKCYAQIAIITLSKENNKPKGFKVNLTTVTNSNQVNTMTSREIAELTGKQHKNVIRDIRVMLEQLGESADSRYLIERDSRGYTRQYNLPRRECEILTQKYKFKHRAFGDREHGALCAIEQLLNITLERQYKVGKYRIDGYCIETNTAYEIDEEQHRTPSSIAKDNKRQSFIENELGCNFVRINVSHKKVK